MTTLVVGASGATGLRLVEQLLNRGERVRAVVRSAESLPDKLRHHKGLDLIEASLLDLDDQEMAKLVDGCSAVASCLGHNLTFKGMFGHPRRLVTDATRRLARAIQQHNANAPVRFVLMNTTGNSNRDLEEHVSCAQRLVIGLLRVFLPPHLDNEKAADFLRTRIGQDDERIEWVAVRPDGLIDLEEVTAYTLHPSPTRSAIFDAGTTSRINVAHFMAELICSDAVWRQWKGQMPVIYNRVEPSTD
ncbi:NAD(P)H-binding [Cohaesibacter sp. ES.047]|uniref:NAD(P)-dependent oxidoreductase n=1 Tax=Cohaesibacter sp. ES.047 TaxID=1798205 RepID=UPI000BB8D759|nr:NAD(P)-binding oxidoreductase [Cohaesibacter sp. ES.047]SNY93184.1 NAD(P)H-binding [Cohaesibacter sp. ES.047]